MMIDGPDLSRIASLVGDPARASMLTALMNGGALTASELALEAGVTPQTTSSHLGKLVVGGLLVASTAGRHRYYALAGPSVATMLEAIMGVAEAVGPKRVRPGPRDAAMRQSRICYDHLAGDRAVAMLDRFLDRGLIEAEGDGIRLARSAGPHFAALGIDTFALAAQRRPACRTCLDWSVRRSHLAGALGAAILDQVLSQRWARRDPASRAVIFSPPGRLAFERAFLD
jgi:DNA-binding transcriptional ArsR family regulator